MHSRAFLGATAWQLLAMSYTPRKFRERSQVEEEIPSAGSDVSEFDEDFEREEDWNQLVALAKKLVPLVCFTIGTRIGQWSIYYQLDTVLPSIYYCVLALDKIMSGSVDIIPY